MENDNISSSSSESKLPLIVGILGFALGAAGLVLGIKAKGCMDKGELVPDEVVIGIVVERLKKPDVKDGFILDGFPRTVAQAQALSELLAKKDMRLDAVIELKVDEAALLSRIEKRARETIAAGGTVAAAE